MTKDVYREKMSKFALLSGCTYNDEIGFVGIEPIIASKCNSRLNGPVTELGSFPNCSLVAAPFS